MLVRDHVHHVRATLRVLPGGSGRGPQRSLKQAPDASAAEQRPETPQDGRGEQRQGVLQKVAQKAGDGSAKRKLVEELGGEARETLDQPGQRLGDRLECLTYEAADPPDGSTDPPECATNSSYKSHILCLLYTSPSPRDKRQSRMPSSA